MRLVFKKICNRWFCEVPNWISSIDDLEMVDGADEFIEHLANGYEIVIADLTNYPIPEPDYVWEKISDDAFGATYKEKLSSWQRTMWLCPVTIHVFEEYPETIWVKNISRQLYEDKQ